MNVVVYVSDALRTDHLGCYGARFVNTKTIDELAAGGVRYAQAISAAPWTAPSTTSIVTGVYAHHHGYLHWDAPLDASIRALFAATLHANLSLLAHAVTSVTRCWPPSTKYSSSPRSTLLGKSPGK